MNKNRFDPMTLEIYRALFTSVAEEMGVALRRTAFSPNIKERRDYSCAVFDAGGRVIAQGDHMPVHLGSMPMAVAAALAEIDLVSGDTDSCPFSVGESGSRNTAQTGRAVIEAAEAARHGARTLEPAKADEVTSRVIADRMLFAEGVRLGLDRDDPIIQQRVVQKVLLLAESLGGATREPTRAELRAHYALVAARYRKPPIYHVMHVFAARREDHAWIEQQLHNPESLFVPVWRNRNLVRGMNENAPEAVYITGEAAATLRMQEGPWAFLGLMQDKAVFAIDISKAEDPLPLLPEEYGQFVDLRSVGWGVPRPEASVLAHARGLMHWRARWKQTAPGAASFEPARFLTPKKSAI